MGSFFRDNFKGDGKMRGYSIYRRDSSGFEDKRQYSINYSAAVQIFNNLLRKSVSEVYETIEREHFSQIIIDFKRDYLDPRLENKIEMICRKNHFIIYREKGYLIAIIYYWSEPLDSEDYQEITTEQIILEEIELIE